MEIYKILGMRENNKEEFHKLVAEGNAEAKEISNGYSNPIVVANVLKCRVKCLEDILSE